MMTFFSKFRIFLWAFLVIVGLILFLPIDTTTFSTVHPTFVSMQKSGISLMSVGNIHWLAILLGVSIMGFFSFSAYLGLKRKERSKNQKIQQRILITLGIYLLMYTIMLIIYGKYGDTGEYLMGFPTPTAWMIYGVGLAPAPLTYWYIKNFDKWVINSEDLKKVQAILAEEESDLS